MALIIAYQVARGKADDETFIEQTRIGDAYNIKLDNRKYTFYRIYSVEGDKVSDNPHELEVEGYFGLRKLENTHKNNYSDTLLAFSKKDLNEMLNKGAIRDVERQ